MSRRTSRAVVARSRSRALAAAAAVAAALALTLHGAPAQAADAPTLAVQQRGDCPSAAQLRRGLRAAFRLASRSSRARDSWRLQLRETPAGALELSLRAPDGRRSFARTLRSRDCEARAAAVTIILKAHFVELSLPRALDPRLPAAKAAPPRAAKPRRPAARPPAPPVPRRWALGLAGGVVTRLSPAPAAGASGQLDVALAPLSAPLGLRLVGLVAQPTSQRAARDRTSIRRLSLRLDALWRIAAGRRLWLQPALGGGAAITWVTAHELVGAPTTLRAHPLLAAALALGVALSRRLSLRIELTATLYLRADRYVITPDGEVARSARATLLANAGLQLDTFW